jgi:hypothetical protein
VNLPEKVGLLSVPEPRTRLSSNATIACVCECGTIVRRKVSHLKLSIRSGALTSCLDCARLRARAAALARNETRYRGRVVGQLTVGPYCPVTGSFACQCSCGGHSNISAHRLREAVSSKLNVGCENCRAKRVQQRRRQVGGRAA